MIKLIIPIICLISCITITSCKNKGIAKDSFETLGNEPKQDGMNEAMEQEFEATKNLNTNSIDVAAKVAANEYRNNLLATGRTSGLSWVERGPNNRGGRTRAICRDIRDATGNTIWAGGVGGGIWKCTNFKTGGATWSKINDNLPNLAISVIEQDKVNLNIFYAGTGEGYFNSDAAQGRGVYKSTDGGVTWVVLPSTIGFEFVQDVVCHPSGAVFVSIRNSASANRGIHKSIDGGVTFTQVAGQPDASYLSGRGGDMEVASNGDMYITLGFSGTQGKLYKATNNGLNTGNAGSWIDITPLMDATLQRIDIAVAPTNPDKLFMISQPSSGGIKAFTSPDAGLSWTPVTIPFLGATQSDFANTQGWYDLICGFHPTEEGTLFVGGLNLGRSTDFGVSWTQLSDWANGGIFPYVHADQHNIIFDKVSSTQSGIIVANDGGLFYSSDIGAAVTSPTFSEKTTNYSTLQFYSADFHPTLPDYFLAGAQDNGSHRFVSPGYGPSNRVTGGDGAISHINQLSGDNQVNAYVYNNYYLTTNSWASGTVSKTLGGTGTMATGRFINPTDLDDAGNLLYCGHNANTYAILNNINNPALAAFSTTTLAEFGGTRVSAVKVDPNTSTTVYFAGNAGGVAPKLLRVENAHLNPPTVTDISIPTAAAGSYIYAIEVDKANSSHIVVVISNYGASSVFETTNGGQTWTAIEGNLPDMPVFAAVILPASSSLTGSSATGGIVLGTEVGIWSTTTSNGAATVWVPDNSGLANSRVHSLKYRAANNSLVAATHGRGLFTCILPTIVLGVNNIAQDRAFVNYISASRGSLLIKTGNLNGLAPIDVRIIDMKGAIVYQSKHPYQPTEININGLPSAAYTVQVASGKRRFVSQIIK
jgi:hypothetical protein